MFILEPVGGRRKLWTEARFGTSCFFLPFLKVFVGGIFWKWNINNCVDVLWLRMNMFPLIPQFCPIFNTDPDGSHWQERLSYLPRNERLRSAPRSCSFCRSRRLSYIYFINLFPLLNFMIAGLYLERPPLVNCKHQPEKAYTPPPHILYRIPPPSRTLTHWVTWPTQPITEVGQKSRNATATSRRVANQWQ